MVKEDRDLGVVKVCLPIMGQIDIYVHHCCLLVHWFRTAGLHIRHQHSTQSFYARQVEALLAVVKTKPMTYSTAHTLLSACCLAAKSSIYLSR
ncbi:hypothetical protein KC328_g83 [Hortaea werneckii]|nr:hypothetical protein KC328_g83 [Hortaea werneckii]